MLYSKNGSIPKPETDGTDGWMEVPDAPDAPEGKEVVWWYPPGWIIRDPKPTGNWSWSQSEERWVEYVIQEIQSVDALESVQINAITSSVIQTLTSEQISGL